jgi:hypothetical protein
MPTGKSLQETFAPSVKLKRITPMDTTLQLRARVTESTENTAVVDAEIVANGKVTSTCRRGRARASGLSPLGVNTSSPKSV